LIGALLTISILALQLYYGVIPSTLTFRAVESVGWPYLIVIIALCLLSAGRAPAQLDAEFQTIVKQLSTQLELPNKAQAEHLINLLSRVGDTEKMVIRFVLMHDEISKQYINIPTHYSKDIGEALYTCVKIGLLRVRSENNGEYSSMAFVGGSSFYYVPLEFRETLKRLLYTTPALSNSFNSHT